ncbi:MAG: hypothetical protein GF313_09720 [Caldithrix sp.]|nr:hypothetical protein [Caldithrix sp.]
MQHFVNNAILEPLQNLLTQIYQFIPNFFAMVLILIVGIIVAFLVKKIAMLILKLLKFDRLTYNSGLQNTLVKSGIHKNPSEVIGVFVYWLLFLVFLMFALNALKVTALNALISGFFLFIPNLIIGCAIFLVGFLLSVIIERTVLIAAVNAELQFARLLAKATQFLVLAFFLAIALEQIGIGQNIVIAAFTILFGGIVLAAALALGLGGRELGKAWLERQFQLKNDSKDDEKNMWSHL